MKGNKKRQSGFRAGVVVFDLGVGVRICAGDVKAEVGTGFHGGDLFAGQLHLLVQTGDDVGGRFCRDCRPVEVGLVLAGLAAFDEADTFTGRVSPDECIAEYGEIVIHGDSFWIT